ncbi:ABC transporter substrate-binding protein [Bacillus sp. CECT 9360]|uniref:ABC transporter substrate-binding protein n=1 Tax=Bacillus sp. CECT 9360 TaxID=2845821 RepID=UPI001E4F01F9|nr:ABC transporter substrate-binding protein [Bacillus sp. CECT 9360]CAH0346536.1 Putative aliphatic sulfonates-binding protein [Bacillus sp. CECT 9360]
MNWKKTMTLGKFAVLMMMMVFVVSGCGGQQSAGGSSSSKGSGGDKMDEIDISVTHYPTGLYAVPYDVGMEKGFFEEEGIKINKIVGSGGGGTTVRNVLSGDLPFGDVSTSAVLQSYLAGAPLKIVGGGVQSVSDLVYVTRKDADIEKVEDMVGKTWAFTNPGSVTETTSQLIFDSAGVDPKSLELVASGGVSEGLTMLQAKEVDATLMMEPAYSVQKDDWKTLFRVSDHVPNYQQSVIITSPQLIKENPDLVKRFLKAYQKSVEWTYANPEEAGKIFAKSAEIDEVASVAAIKDLADKKHWSSKIEADSINNVVKGMQMANTLKKDQEILWDEVLDMDFLPEDQRLDPKDLKKN